MMIRSLTASLGLILALSLTACTTMPPLPYPELPRKNWLDGGHLEDAKGKVATSDIYSPDKKMKLQDLVWLAVQLSPALNRSAINLDISRVGVTDAKYKYVPEIHLNYTISNNITRYNESDKKKLRLKDYGETAYQLNFGGVFNNPVATYLEVEVKKELLAMAGEKNRDAVAKCVEQIAAFMIELRQHEDTLKLLERQKEFAEHGLRFMRTAGQYTVNIRDNEDSRLDTLKDIELRAEESRAAIRNVLLKLKLLVGLELEQKLLVDTESAVDEVMAFDSSKYTWRQCWEGSTDRKILQNQIVLEGIGVYVALARYVPNINFSINESAPNGQSQPSNGETDKFAHIYLNFPLLDWGHRYRDSEISSYRKRQARLDAIGAERDYSSKWYMAESDVRLAEAKLAQASHASQTREKRMKAYESAFEHGGVSFLEYSQAETELLDSKVAALKAYYGVLQARMNWMRLAQVFRSRFIDSATAKDTK